MISFIYKSNLRLGVTVILGIILIYILIYVALSVNGGYVLRQDRAGRIYDIFYPRECFLIMDLGNGKYNEKPTLVGKIYYPFIMFDRTYVNKSSIAYSAEGDGYWVKPERQGKPVF